MNSEVRLKTKSLKRERFLASDLEEDPVRCLVSAGSHNVFRITKTQCLGLSVLGDMFKVLILSRMFPNMSEILAIFE